MKENQVTLVVDMIMDNKIGAGKAEELVQKIINARTAQKERREAIDDVGAILEKDRIDGDGIQDSRVCIKRIRKPQRVYVRWSEAEKCDEPAVQEAVKLLTERFAHRKPAHIYYTARPVSQR